jgi:hypothetical protein
MDGWKIFLLATVAVCNKEMAMCTNLVRRFLRMPEGSGPRAAFPVVPVTVRTMAKKVKALQLVQTWLIGFSFSLDTILIYSLVAIISVQEDRGDDIAIPW